MVRDRIRFEVLTKYILGIQKYMVGVERLGHFAFGTCLKLRNLSSQSFRSHHVRSASTACRIVRFSPYNQYILFKSYQIQGSKNEPTEAYVKCKSQGASLQLTKNLMDFKSIWWACFGEIRSFFLQDPFLELNVIKDLLANQTQSGGKSSGGKFRRKSHFFLRFFSMDKTKLQLRPYKS